jgi:hypothetical protein
MSLLSSAQTLPALAVAAGLALAVVLLAVSPRLAARLGRARGRLIGGGLAAAVAVLVCFVGVRTTTYELRLVLAAELAEAADPPSLLAATEAALEVATTDEFLAYAARLYQLDPPSPQFVRDHIKLHPVRHGELDPDGRLIPRPREAATALALEYSAAALSPLIALTADEHARALAVVERIAPRLGELVLVELYRQASSDDARQEALARLRAGVTAFAEWIDRDLAAFAADASPALSTSLAEARAQLARAIADPAARGVLAAAAL